MIKGIFDTLLGDRSHAGEAEARKHAMSRTDVELLAARSVTDGQPDPEMDALEAEIARRGLQV